jgi:hypothetical protein
MILDQSFGFVYEHYIILLKCMILTLSQNLRETGIKLVEIQLVVVSNFKILCLPLGFIYAHNIILFKRMILPCNNKS